MHSVFKHMGFQLAVLYFLLIGVYSQVGFSFLNDSENELATHFVSSSFKAAFDNPFYGTQPEVCLTEFTIESIFTLNYSLKFFSVFSKSANQAATRQMTDYIYFSSIIVVQPQLFDILFPFHYYL